MSNSKINPNDFINALKDVAKQYEVSSGKIGDMIANSFVKVYTKSKEECTLFVNVDVDNGTIDAYEELKVIDNLPDGEYDDFFEITIDEAKQYGDYKIGDICKKPYDLFSPKNFGTTQIRQIMQIFRQKLNEVNNSKIYDAWIDKVGELITAPIEKFDDKNKFYLIELDDGKNFGFLSNKECIPGETLLPGEKYKYLVKEVKQQSRGWPIILSRADAGFVKKIISLEIPEISTGEIVIEKIERIAGFKTKIAITSSNNTFDPVGICVGAKGARIKALSEQLNNEKIEIIPFIQDKKEFLITAIGAKNMEGLKFIEANSENDIPHATIIVSEDKLATVIGKKGFNIKLVSKIVGCSVDVLTVEQAKISNIEYDRIDYTKYNITRTSRTTPTNYSGINKSSSHAKVNFEKYMSNDELLSQLNESTDSNNDIYKNLTMEKTHFPHQTEHFSINNDDNLDDFDFDDADLGDLEEEFAAEINDALNEKK